MSKFKVGDRVKVVRMSGEPYYDDYVSIEATGKIVQFGEEKTSGRRVYVKFDGGQFTPCHNSSWYVDENMLELVHNRLESFVWYKSADHKLQAGEIEGRIVLEDNGQGVFGEFHLGCSLPLTWIDSPCIQYMLIDPAPQEEEPLEFDGCKPEIEIDYGGYSVIHRGVIDISTPICNEEQEAIHAWNEWVRAHTK